MTTERAEAHESERAAFGNWLERTYPLADAMPDDDSFVIALWNCWQAARATPPTEPVAGVLQPRPIGRPVDQALIGGGPQCGALLTGTAVVDPSACVTIHVGGDAGGLLHGVPLGGAGALYLAGEPQRENERLRARLAALEAAAVPVEVVRWAVTLDGEFTDNIFRTREQAEAVKADLDRKHPDYVRKIVPLAALATLQAAEPAAKKDTAA